MNEISCKIMCLSMRNGVEIWLEDARIENLRQVLASPNTPQFITLPDQQLINRSDIVGVFSPKSMESLTERKNGVWRCKQGKAHDRGEKCDCMPQKARERNAEMYAAIAKCTLGCSDGYIAHDDGSCEKCECLARFNQENPI